MSFVKYLKESLHDDRKETQTFYSLDVYKNEGINAISQESSDKYILIEYISVATDDRGKGIQQFTLKL